MTKAEKLLNTCEVYDQIFTQGLLEVNTLFNADESLFETDEGVKDFISSAKKQVSMMLGKLGFEVHQTQGLLQILAGAGLTITRLMFHAIKAFVRKDEQSLAKLKEMLTKEIKKEQLYDFLLKLDMATLHLISGPIHLIDAITGWHLAPKLDHGHHGNPEKEGKQKNIAQKFKDAVLDLRDISKQLTPKNLKEGVQRHVKGIVDVYKAHTKASGKQSILKAS